MPFSDARVQGYIDSAMAFAGNNTNIAWAHLYQLRQHTDPNDTNAELAAAEHYMYARDQVGSGQTSGAMMRLLTVGYDPVKLLGYSPPIWIIRQIAGHTWTRPSTDSIRWGWRGCNAGNADAAARARP